MTRVLVIEDDPATRQVLVDLLQHLGYEPAAAISGAHGLELASRADPELIVLDLGLPDISGIEVIRQLRMWSEVPVIVVSGSTHIRRKADALDAGADDFLDKPFNVGELRARLRVAERHAATSQGDTSAARAYGELVIDPIARTVTRDGVEVRLTETEWLLLDELSQQAGRVLTHRRLISKVWGSQVAAEATASLRSHLRSLRSKIGDDAREACYIRTESGVGYRWVAQPKAVTTSSEDPVQLARNLRSTLLRSLEGSGHTSTPELIALVDEVVDCVARIVEDSDGERSESVEVIREAGS